MAKAEKKQRKPIAAEIKKQYEDQRVLFASQDAERSPAQVSVGGQPNKKRSPVLIEAFLTWLSKGYSPSFAAKKIGISRVTAFKWREDDDQFRAAWAAAIEAGTDFFEDEARRRAAEGVDRPVFQMGECVGFTREYSDSLLAMQMKGRRPERYGDKVAHTGAEGGAIKHHIEVEFVKPGDKS